MPFDQQRLFPHSGADPTGVRRLSWASTPRVESSGKARDCALAGDLPPSAVGSGGNRGLKRDHRGGLKENHSLGPERALPST